MADTIKCPVCGENNSAGQEFCQNCQSRLRPPAEAAKGTDAAIKPGQAPIKRDTADLEPILPQWLRDARDSARNSEPQDSFQFPQQPEQKKQPAASPSEDLLAGLRSQSQEDEEDDTPDWLASITGSTAKAKNPSTESSEARRVELGGMEDFAQEESASDAETPSWLTNLAPNDSHPGDKDELDATPIETPKASAAFDDSFLSGSSADDAPDWLRQMASDEDVKKEQQTSSFDSPSNIFPSADSETPDWLKQMAAEQDSNQQSLSFDTSSNAAAAEDSGTPDWLRQMAAADNLNTSTAPADVNNDAPDMSIDVPDWLLGMADKAKSDDTPNLTESGSDASEPPALVNTGQLPSWLNDPVDNAPKPTEETTPKWLKKDAPASVTGELPAWLSSSEETMRISGTPKELTPIQDEPAQSASLDDLPDWLKASAPLSNLFEEPVQASSEDSADASSNAPDQLSTFKAEESQPAQKAGNEIPFDMPNAFVADEHASDNTDDLFTEMPDWLSNAMDLPASPTPITNTDAIAPGELPSWVQAMRPVDAAPSSFSSSLAFSSDQTLESRGALAGLQGVLPLVQGFTPTSKPKPYSIRLRATEEQQSQAELLEQILAAETAPEPIASFSALRTSRSLRWFLSIVIFMAVITGLTLGTPIFSMPTGVPREIDRAINLSKSLPEGAPVLVAFDFEASRVGEMEAAAAPFFDQIILNSHPNLTFISTSEMGSLLAERFVSGPLAGHYKNSEFNYLNLGYLPGGQLGIRAFAQNPRGISPLDVYLQPAWASTPNELTSLSQLFMAMVLVTDNADSARAWIEQTTSSRGNLPMVVITSAQAAPMIQPYFESQQVSGMVAGLYGGAVFEQKETATGTIKIARNYWDAYSFGMLLAMSLVLGGGLWNFVLGLRDQSSAREAK